MNDSDQSKRPRRILFYCPFGSFTVHHQIDAVVAMTLRSRRCDVLMVTCDGLYKTCDVLSWSGDFAQAQCKACQRQAADLFGAFNLPNYPMSRALFPEDYEEAQAWVNALDPSNYENACYDTVPLGSWVTSSVFSHFRITHAELHKPHVQAAHKEFLRNGLLTYRSLSRIIADWQPDNMMVYNARYAPYSVAFELGRQAGIPVITHERGMANNTFTLYENYTAIQTKPIFEALEAWKDIPLNLSELETCKRYFVDRERGVDSNWPAFFSFQSDYALVRQRLNIPAEAPIVGVFTSSEFELAYCKDFNAFASQLEVIERLIEVFRNRKEYLIIRHHPFLMGTPASNPDYGFLTRAYRQARNAPTNVRIIMPADPFKTYELLPNLDAGIGFISTLGIEGVARGIPMAGFTQSPYRDALQVQLSNHSETSLNQVIDRLLGLRETFSAEYLRRCYRLMHCMISRVSVKFNSLGIRNVCSPNIQITKAEDIQAGADPTLDRICDNILTGSSLLELPSAEHRERSNSEEDSFFSKELLEISELRRTLSEQSRELQLNATSPITIGVIIVDSSHSGENPSPAANWIKHSRHQAIHLYSCSASFQDLRQAVSRTCEDYVLVTDGQTFYDEAFLSECLKKFSESTEKIPHAVSAGAWIHNDQQIITRSIFTERFPGKNLEELLGTIPEFEKFSTMVSLTLWRTAGFAAILEAVEKVEEELLRIAMLFVATRGEGTQTIPLPLALIQSVKA